MSTRALTEHNQLACPFVSEISPGDQIDLIVLTIQCWLLLKSLTLSKSRAQTLDALLKHSRMFSSFAFWLLARSTAGEPKHVSPHIMAGCSAGQFFEQLPWIHYSALLWTPFDIRKHQAKDIRRKSFGTTTHT